MAKDPYTQRTIELIDRNGCPVDPSVFSALGLSRSGDGIETTFNAFKIPESNFLVFEATVNTCRGGCKPVRFQFFGLNCEVQVVLCQISIFCHQLTDFVRFTKIDTNCSDIEFQNKLFM